MDEKANSKQTYFFITKSLSKQEQLQRKAHARAKKKRITTSVFLDHVKLTEQQREQRIANACEQVAEQFAE